MKHILKMLVPAVCLLLAACGTPSSSESESPAETTTTTATETTSRTDTTGGAASGVQGTQPQEQSNSAQESVTRTEAEQGQNPQTGAVQPNSTDVQNPLHGTKTDPADSHSAATSAPGTAQSSAQSSTAASATFDISQDGVIELPIIPLD